MLFLLIFVLFLPAGGLASWTADCGLGGLRIRRITDCLRIAVACGLVGLRIKVDVAGFSRLEVMCFGALRAHVVALVKAHLLKGVPAGYFESNP